ncbi:methyl-accepting chemotaxis protein [Brevibacillus panacihumi]|uniref:Methyl-accepting chemotaxis protein n=1 Tax=Brevibacillus panacihumi TaxID=497735 RepID=A0A3M8DDF2_9BACL|nr:methyl-accepting chemotaxis protein [Brevibacillus panacihumi]RNB85601.1 methyl-accepting chemotaxis protein [Brevibacillus panacihumi]
MKLRLQSIFGKSILSSTIYILITGIIITIASSYIQGKVFLESFQQQAIGFGNYALESFKGKDLTQSDAELVKQLDLISERYPQIAQAYFFGTELQNGNETSIILSPTHIVEMLKQELQIGPGDFYAQPDILANKVREMLETGEAVTTEPYTDDIGTWVSVLIPLKEADGSIHKYFGLDIDASIISKAQLELLKSSSIVLIFVILIVLIVQFFTTKRMLAPIQDIQQAFAKLSNGDFSVSLQIRKKDELGMLANDFNKMVTDVREIMSKVKQTSDDTAHASKELLQIIELTHATTNETTLSMKEVASGAQTQVARSEESGTAIEEMAIGIQRIAESASEVSESATKTFTESETGAGYIQKTLEQMALIQSSVANSALSVKNLDEKSKEIETIVSAITAIADQTNLLALNAAIEAARAGEHGRGFAVVADEVRKLAEQSTMSAQQIIQIIQETKDDTREVIDTMDIVTNNVDAGVQIVKETGTLFSGILKEIKHVTEQIHEVSAVSEQLSAGSEEITAAFQENISIARQAEVAASNMTKAANEQLENMEHMSQSMNQLLEKTTELKQMLNTFKM